MAQGYEIDKSKLLDLLYDYYSEDGRRARRNLSVFSLTIIIPNLLGLDLDDLEVFGLSLKGSDPSILLLIAVGLIGYAFVMVILLTNRDNEIQREQRVQAEKQIEDIRKRRSSILSIRREPDDLAPELRQQVREIDSALGRVAAYQERTRKASRYVLTIRVLTMYTPPFLGVGALGILGLDLWQVTMNVEKAAATLVDWT